MICDAHSLLLQARIARARGEAEARVLEEAAAEANAAFASYVDQVNSPLGNRRHCAATKRRLAAGDPGAAIVGRKHLLSRESLADELAKLSTKPHKANVPAGGPDALRAKLGLVAGGRQ